MRFKIAGKIIEQTQPDKTGCNHETYSMILSNIDPERAKKIHTKKRFKRLFTFSRIFIKDENIHFYVAAEDGLAKELVNYIMFNQLIKIGDKVIKVDLIQPLSNELKEKDEYKFKSNLIVNEMEDGKVCLSNDMEYIKRRINEIAKDKYKDVFGKDIDENIEVEILNYKKTYTKYKDHHLNSYKMFFKLRGSYELINLIYNIGIGENTASGHGLMWEV